MGTLDSLNNIRRYSSCDSHGYMCESCPNDPEQAIKHARLLMLELIAQLNDGDWRRPINSDELRQKIEAL